MTSKYDKTLEQLAGRANEVLNSGDENKISKFDNELKAMASASNKDADSRQAALQLRLPDAKVGRGEEGQLAFSAPRSINPTIPREFAAKAQVVKPGETIIVGDQKDSFTYTSRARQTTEAVVGRQLAGIGDAATSPSIKGLTAQMAALDDIADPVEKQKAFLQLSSSIELAKSSRAIELTTLKEREFGVPQLEAQLRSEEAADRSDPKWMANQVDSAITAQIRSRLRTAKADAFTFAQREVAVDPVIAEMNGKINEVSGILQLEASQLTAEDKKQSAVWDSLSSQSKSKMRAFAAINSDKAVEAVTDQEATKAFHNPNAAEVLTLSPMQLLGASANKGNPNAELYGKVVERMGLVKDIKKVNEYMQGVQQVLASPSKSGVITEDAMSKLNPRMRQMATDSRIRQLLMEDTQVNLSGLSLTKEERQARAAQRSEQVAEIAVRMMQEDEVRGLSTKPVELPPPPSPILQPMIEEAKSNELGIDGMLEGKAVEGLLRTDDPATLQNNIDMITQYVMGVYRSNGPAPVLGMDIMTGFEQQIRLRLQARSHGLDQGEGPFSIMQNYMFWNWPGRMVGESFNAIERNVPADSQYARFIRNEG
jgi:hypothetical protein